MGAINLTAKGLGVGRGIKWLASLLFFLLVSQPSCCIAEAAYDSRLWKVQSLVTTSYLFGTMHVSDRDIVHLPRQLESIINTSNILALEVKMTELSARQAKDAFLLSHDQTLRSIVGADLFQKVESALRGRGVGSLEINKYKPWAASLLLTFPPSSEGVVLDQKLHDLFVKKGKLVVGLETVPEQVQYFDAMSLSDQIDFLELSVSQMSDFDSNITAMKRLYLNGDLSGLQAMATEHISLVQGDSIKRMMDSLIDTRNQVMVNRALPILAKGSAFIAVGALHLPGEKGVIALLRKKGYRVSPVYLQ